MKVNALMMDETDNVVTCVREVPKGETVAYRDGDDIKTIEAKQKAKHECPVCHHMSVKRISSGIWFCKHCETKFAAEAYSPKAKKEISQVSEQ